MMTKKSPLWVISSVGLRRTFGQKSDLDGMSQIRVLVVEDEPLIAEDIRETLNNVDFEVSGVAYDPETALTELRDNTPDIVLLDINLGANIDGIQIADRINREYKIPIVFLTSYSDRESLGRAKAVRPMGYVVKPFDERNLFTTLEIAMHNFTEATPRVVLNLNTINHKLLSKLSEKEFEVLEAIFQGKTNLQMANEQYVSVNTIKTHVKNIYDKLDVTSRTQSMVKVRNICTFI